MAVICFACGKDLLDTPKLKRSLHENSRDSRRSAEEKKRIILALHDFTTAIGIGEDYTEDRLKSQKICRSCFEKYTKYVELKDLLISKLQKAHENMGQGMSSHSVNQPREAQESSVTRDIHDQAPNSTGDGSTSWQCTPIIPPSSTSTAAMTPSSNRQCRQQPRSHGTTPRTPLRPYASAARSSSFVLSGYSNSPPVTVTVAYNKYSKHYVLKTPRKRHMSKALVRGHKKGLVDQCFSDEVTRVHIMNKLSRLVRSEVKCICSSQAQSILRASPHVMHTFCWERLIAEMEKHCPTLLSILYACTTYKKSKKNRVPLVGMCCAMILKFCSQKMSLVQKIMSMVLYAGHCSKQVYQRLSSVNVCMSHASSILTLEKIGQDHDKPVVDWRESVASIMQNYASADTSNQYQTARGKSELLAAVDDSILLVSDIFGTENDSTDDENSIMVGSDTDVDIAVVDETSECDSESSDSDGQQFDVVDNSIPIKLVANAPYVLEPSVVIELLPLTQQKPHPGYSFTGDNMDEMIRRRFLRSNKRDTSAHYFHSFAQLNRVGFAELSSQIPDHSDIQDYRVVAGTLQPSSLDDSILRRNVSTIVSRILCKRIKFFDENFRDVIDWHIPHKFSQEMTVKSKIVPLGVQLKNENRGDDMLDILYHLHQYVPQLFREMEVELEGSGRRVAVEAPIMHRIIVGGDQLTSTRIRSAIKAKENSQTPSRKLAGIIPVAEHWHTKANYLGVIWKYYFNQKSGTERGSLYQLRNLLNRRNVVNIPINKFDACDEFFMLVIDALVVNKAINLFEMSSADGVPSDKHVPDKMTLSTCDKKKRKDVLESLMATFMDDVFMCSFNEPPSCETVDKIDLYAKILLNLGFIYHEFSDAIREGDGLRVLRSHRYLLPIFISSGRTNYSIECMHYLMQHDYLLSEREAAEFVWNRFVNVHGRPGCNIPNDLHLEHLNRICKNAIKCLGPNRSERSITRVGKAIGILSDLLHNFDEDSGIHSPSGHHKKPDDTRDLNIIVHELQAVSIFNLERSVNRHYASFPAPRNPLHAITKDQLTKWMIEHIQL